MIYANDLMTDSNSEAVLEVTNDVLIMTNSESFSLNWSNTNDKFIVVGCKDAYVYVFNTLDGS
jgi:hypothetical protein